MADSLPLAVLEILVRLQHVGTLSGFSQARVEIPDRAVETIDRKDLPEDWRTSPRPEAVVAIGERWVREARTAVLAVPSALLPSEKNFVMNPAHRDFGRVRVGPIEPLDVDPRLLRPSIQGSSSRPVRLEDARARRRSRCPRKPSSNRSTIG